MKNIFLIIIVTMSVNVFANPTPKVLRQAKAIVSMQKEWYVKENNELVLKTEKVCEKETLIDVWEYDVQETYESNPQIILCTSSFGNTPVNLVAIGIVIETSNGSVAIPLLPSNKRVKMFSGIFSVSDLIDGRTKVQSPISNLFITEDLGLKNAYFYLTPPIISSSETTCDTNGNCTTQKSDAPEAYFHAVLKIEDNQ